MTENNSKLFELFRRQPIIASGEHYYDCLGTSIHRKYLSFWHSPPPPAGKRFIPDWPRKDEHYIDWICVLSAVSAASGIFRFAELGAGWGHWSVRAALAARQRKNLETYEIVAVEAEPQRHRWMQEHFQENGIYGQGVNLFHAAVALPGVATRFPIVEHPDTDYGASIEQARQGKKSREIRVLSLEQIMSYFTGPVDLIHADVQGAEYEIFPASRYILQQRIKAVCVGTHFSDKRHQGLKQFFQDMGWTNIFCFKRKSVSATPYGSIEFEDGLQFWVNPELTDPQMVSLLENEQLQA